MEYRCLNCGRLCDADSGKSLPRDTEFCSHEWEEITEENLLAQCEYDLQTLLTHHTLVMVLRALTREVESRARVHGTSTDPEQLALAAVLQEASELAEEV